MCEYLTIYPDNINPKHIQKAVSVLKKGGLIIYPTDTVYALGCDITCEKALQRIADIKKIKLEKAHFSFVCKDLKNLSQYVKQIDGATFRLLKSALPGPFTFILPSGNALPKFFKKKKTVGIRIPDNPISMALIEALGNPIVSTSIHDTDKIIDYTTDPEQIYQYWSERIDIFVDGGYGGNIPSTVIDVTTNQPQIVRQGKGPASIIGL